MRILLTGATGFIGKRTVKRLSTTNHQLVLLVRKTSRIDLLQQYKPKIMYGDVLDRPSLLDAMENIDCLVNLANVYSFWEVNKKNYWKINVDGTRNVMEAAIQSNIKKVIHISSQLVFGRPAEIPFTENSQPGTQKFSEYARSKYAGDCVVRELIKEHALSAIILYLAAVLGVGDPKETGRYMQNLLLHCLPMRIENDNKTTYVYVGDVAEAIYLTIVNDIPAGEEFIIGKYQLSFREINQLISKFAHISLPKYKSPPYLVFISAYFLTKWANLIKKQPYLDLSIDAVRTALTGTVSDGSKAEKELGLVYTPLDKVIKEIIDVHLSPHMD